MHGAGIFVRADGAHTKARGRTICKKMRYRESDLIKLDILINGDSVEPLAMIVHRDKVIILQSIHGGDISRKKKLLKKQAEGKKRMKSIGKVDVPQEAFMAVLKLEKEVI
ncbi:uncharacterized protein DS421_18g632930 [Arachis hypogaea]|nr:uncharacterized protein DS421_18g632930 [Arachis hypogaea]